MNEKELQRNVFSFFQLNKKKAFLEIPFMSRIIDLVLLENEYIVTIEFKIKDWRKAINQMLEHRIASDLCALCMPQERVSNSKLNMIKNELSIYGFGFYIWNEKDKNLTTVLKGQKNYTISEIASNKLLENIKEQGWQL